MPIQYMDPAKNILFTYAHWNFLEWNEFPKNLKYGDKCEIPPKFSLAYAYFKSFGVTDYKPESEFNTYATLKEIASSLDFYKERVSTHLNPNLHLI